MSKRGLLLLFLSFKSGLMKMFGISNSALIVDILAILVTSRLGYFFNLVTLALLFSAFSNGVRCFKI